MHHGMVQIRHIWNSQACKFLSLDEASDLFQLQPPDLYIRLIASLLQDWLYMFQEERYDRSPDDFLAVFPYEDNTFSSLVCQTSRAYYLQMRGGQVDFFLLADHPSFIVGSYSFILSPRTHIGSPVDEIHQGWVCRVSILEFAKESKLFIGITSQLHYDLGR